MDNEERKREKQRKKRKMLKPFREYTNCNRDEGRFKGWSKRVASDMALMSKKLRVEKPAECAKFRKAYREVYRARNKEKQKPSKVEDEPVDYDELWDLDNVDPVVI